MSDNSKDSGGNYTVDDILSEYSPDKSGESVKEETSPAEDISYDDEDEDNEPEEIIPEIKPESILGAAPADTYSVTSNTDPPEKLFGNDVEALPVTEETADVPDSGDNDNYELENAWEAGAEEAADAEDEGAFTEELEEDEVSAGETAESDKEAAAENAGGADVITDDEPEEEEKSGSGSDEADENGKEEAAGESDTAAEESSAKAEAPRGEKKQGFWQGLIPWKGDSVFEIIRKIIFIIAVTVFIGAGIMLASTLIQSKKAVSDAEEIKSVVTTTAATTIDSDGNVIVIAPTEEEIIEHNVDIMKYYKEISENVVGYIEIEGCDIYYPVVQGKDNDYYLNHTYYDEINKGGAVFADYRCVFGEEYNSPNIVIYGHNQEDGTMFGNLKNYKQDVKFYAANPAVTFNTEYGIGTYLIYGYFVTNALEKQDSNGEVFHYHDYIETMNDEATFNWYLKEVQKRNQIIPPVDVEFGDKLLCLSTCSNEFSNSRFVVFARKLREGESVSDYDFSKTTYNPNAKGVDWTAILSGESNVTEPPEETTRKKKTNLAQSAGNGEEEEAEETSRKKKTSAETTATEPEETTRKKKTTAAAEESAEALPENTEPAVTEAPSSDTEPPATETGGITQS